MRAPVLLTLSFLFLPPSLPAEEPLAAYPFDGDFRDATPNAFHGRPLRGAGFTDGLRGRALNFNGRSSFVLLPNRGQWRFGTGDFTLSFQLQLPPGETGSAAHGLISQGWSEPLAPGSWALVLDKAGEQLTYKAVNGQGQIAAQISRSLDGAQTGFVQVTLRRQAGRISLWLNGKMLGDEEGSAAVDLNTEAPLHLGRAGNNQFAAVAMDELYIFDQALSPIGIKILHDEPFAIQQPIQSPVSWRDRQEAEEEEPASPGILGILDADATQEETVTVGEEIPELEPEPEPEPTDVEPATTVAPEPPQPEELPWMPANALRDLKVASMQPIDLLPPEISTLAMPDGTLLVKQRARGGLTLTAHTPDGPRTLLDMPPETGAEINDIKALDRQKIVIIGQKGNRPWLEILDYVEDQVSRQTAKTPDAEGMQLHALTADRNHLYVLFSVFKPGGNKAALACLDYDASGVGDLRWSAPLPMEQALLPRSLNILEDGRFQLTTRHTPGLFEQDETGFALLLLQTTATP